ncbi:MAG: DUF4129 domain-containing protein [Anaerolineales bacterium]|nr:DUF4129 domain-containing protein [Anaerolineales bacterium]
MAHHHLDGLDPVELLEVNRDPWTDNFFRPLMIVTMIMCLNVSIVNLVRQVNPNWSGIYFLLAMLITTIEGIYAYRLSLRYRASVDSRLRFRLAEAVVLIVLIKLLNLLQKPLTVAGAELRAIWDMPHLFFTTEFYVSVTLAFLAWAMATATIADFEYLYDPYIDNRLTLQSLIARFFWGGIILVLISGVTHTIAQFGLDSLTNLRRPALGGVIFNALLYFAVGLILLSQVNLTRLLVRWRLQHLTPPPHFTRNWAKYAFIFWGLVMVIAFLLPTHYTLGFLRTAGLVVQFIIAILVFLVQLLIILVTIPVLWLLSLIGFDTPTTPPPLPSPPPVAPPSAEGGYPPWWEILRSLLFWLVALGVLGYFIKIYLEDHAGTLQSLKKFKLFDWLLRLWAVLWRSLRGWAEAGLALLPSRELSFRPVKPVSTSRLRNWLNLRQASARQRVLYYYLNILNRAEQAGLHRRESQTPYEYEPSLQESIPTVETEIHDVTDTFVRARYSPDEFSEQEVALIKQEWQRIKKALRKGPSDQT